MEQVDPLDAFMATLKADEVIILSSPLNASCFLPTLSKAEFRAKKPAPKQVGQKHT